MVISFLASHNGTVAKDIITAIRNGLLQAEIGVVITNNEKAPIREWCKMSGVEVHYISTKTHPDGCLQDRAISDALRLAKSDYVVLSGYMKRIGDITLSHFENRLLNVHPALLPRHGGEGMYADRVHESVLASGDTQSGATVHIVTAEYDEGPILGQKAVEVTQAETVDSLRDKVQEVESLLFVEVLHRLIAEQSRGV